MVAVYDQGTHDGLPYLVMEYVRGRTLREVLTERRRLNPDEALAIMEQMLAAIAAAHRAGLVHRDVKPENVLVAEAPSGGVGQPGRQRGQGRRLRPGPRGRGQRRRADGSQLMATVAYVAPELVTDGHADPRTDVYSAGIVLFEMLTGRVPYDGDRPVEVAWQHVDRDVPPPSRVPGLPPVARRPGRPGHPPRPGRPPDRRRRDARRGAGGPRGPGRRPNAHTAVLRPVRPTAPTAGASQPTDGGRGRSRRRPTGRPGPGCPSRARRAAAPAAAPRRPGARRACGPGWPAARTGCGDRRGRLVARGAVVVLGLLAAIGGWWFGVGRYTDAPQLVNLTKAEARGRRPTAAGLHARLRRRRATTRRSRRTWCWRRTRPAGDRIVKGGTITLTLSLGPERYPVPDVVGKEFELAEADLISAKLVVQGQPAGTTTTCRPGVVIAINPEVGTEVKPGDEGHRHRRARAGPRSPCPTWSARTSTRPGPACSSSGLVPVEQLQGRRQAARTRCSARSPADGAGVEKGARSSSTSARARRW